MLQNAYLLAKIGADTAENEQHRAEILPTTGSYPTGPPRRAGRNTRDAVAGFTELEASFEARALVGRGVRVSKIWEN